MLATHTPAVGSANTFGYDALQRLSTVSAGVYTKTYNYRNISSTRTTTQVSSLVYSGNVSQTYSYTYDALGNILTYTAPGKAAFTYTYDNQGQLTKATNGTTTYTYTYDTVGNITAANGHSYTYGNTNWRDLLTAYDGESITYDASGNPTSYYNGTRWTMGWKEGRRLTSATDGTTSLAFTYDSEGLRLSKTVGTTKHNYYYAGGKLMRETYGSNTLDFFYDATGTPYALKSNSTVYYYVTNLQGDVINLVNSSGTVVATYDYDPYGKVITATGTLAAVNPLRYRGYYYDSETGMYYLQSRYYDPTIGRFINADSYASTGQGFLGFNMFSYCRNNPTSRTDISGTYDVVCDTSNPLADEEEHGEGGLSGGTQYDPYQAILDTGSPAPYVSNIPQPAWDTLEYIKTHNGHPPDKHKGGKEYANDGRNGGQTLPKSGEQYYEYDIYPKQPGVGRGTERIVLGSDGSAWYTFDHYQSFIRME